MPQFNAVGILRAMKHLVILAVVVAISLVTQAAWPGEVYWSRISATVLAPAMPDSRTLEDNEDPVFLATALALAARGPNAPPRGASPDATLYGEGRFQAVSARVRSVGGQWQSSVREPVITLEVVDSSAERVELEMRDLQEHLASTLDTMQERLNVADSEKFALSFSPATPEVVYIKGNRTRTFVGVTAFLLIAIYLVLPAWRRESGGSTPLSRPWNLFTLRRTTAG